MLKKLKKNKHTNVCRLDEQTLLDNITCIPCERCKLYDACTSYINNNTGLKDRSHVKDICRLMWRRYLHKNGEI